ncbi:MAG: helix-turn-helix domain-containing protein [Nitrospirota bacterium]|nr:MAG: helix-turn-helix domain-containing protein [Nitrospirota bacterium]
MPTESVGPLLKHARETQGLSLDQVASVTRIQLKYLQALEEEQFSALPEPVFTKGFVRTYARSLGMDEHDVLRRFSEASNKYFGTGQQEHERVQSTTEEEKRGKPNRIAMGVLIGVIVLGLGLYLSRQQQPTPAPTPETTESPSVSSPLPMGEETETPPLPSLREHPREQEMDIGSKTISAEPDLPPVALPTVPDQSKPVKPKTPSVSTTTGPLLMELEATQLTWVVVKSDGKEPEEALLQPKQRTTWKANKQFTLTLGNAGGVRVWLNGKSRGPFGKQGQIVREVVIRD